MSDIYVELRSRIAVVAAKTRLGTARIQEAQDRAGLSNEAVARRIPVSEKTWRRWKKAGEVPSASLPAVADALGLELHELSDAHGQPAPFSRPAVAEIAEIRALLVALAERMGVDVEDVLRVHRDGAEAPPRAREAP